MSMRPRTKVYRLRNLPGHVDRHETAQLLARFVENLPLDGINVHSLSSAVDPWESFPTKTATVTFAQEPALPKTAGPTPDEWKIPVPGLRNALILDTHFEGFTPLNDPDPARHTHDCITISGLASHPFGSWQPHGNDKSFMWVRDALPASLPSFRFLTYGYDTTLVDSRSFQSILDLAGRLIFEMKSNGLASPAAKQVVFLAHSLGGLILKQALVMLANSGESETFMLERIRGAILFGVPSQGMIVSHLLAMVKDQPNEALVGDLSVDSAYMANLASQFDGISDLRKMKFFWAYETKQSPTVVKNPSDGSFSRSGPPVVLVSKSSATNGLYLTQPLSTFQIDDDHSGIVKFTQGHNRTGIVAQNLRDIAEFPTATVLLENTVSTSKPEETTAFTEPLEGLPGKAEYMLENGTIGPATVLLGQSVVGDMLNRDGILDSLRAPERDRRLEQVDAAYVNTFGWVYDNDDIGFVNWLRKGQGVFWISGKPGSGKSTLMKLINSDRRTAELINPWGSKSRRVTATFFFHHRGTVIQKSFEGLLRGIISQVLEKEPELFAVIRQMLVEEYTARVNGESLGDLPSDILNLFKLYNLKYDEKSDREVQKIVRSLDVRAQLLEVFEGKMLELTPSKRKHFVEILLAEMNDLLKKNGGLEDKVANLCDKRLPVDYSAMLTDQIRTWLGKVDRETRIQKLLRQSGLSSKDNADENIKKCLARQERRDTIMRDTQQKAWTRHSLEEALSRILGQNMFSLDLTLFLDALDEYDGRPEFIAEFLKEIAEQKYPCTRVRVCFSSRPWNVFIQEFGECPGFKIHDHTEEDIHHYCLDTMSNEPAIEWTINELVPEIVRRAQGVFLWVRLVVLDLTSMARNFDSGVRVDGRKEKLWDTLRALPDQLDDYYATIIRRIPMASRWDTYVLLECVSRARWDLTPDIVQSALECSRSSNFRECKARADQLVNKSLSKAALTRKLRMLSGGLVEAVGFDNDGPTIQLMHQTVKEFIQDPEFKHKILGNLAKVASENGHSFLTKAYLLRMQGGVFRETGVAGHHAREAEITTGRSQYSLFSSVPSGYFPGRSQAVRSERQGQAWLTSPLTFAVFYGLDLYIKEALAVDPNLAFSDPSLFATLLVTLDHGYQPADRLLEPLETAKLLVDCGCQATEEEIVGLSKHYDPLTQDIETLILAYCRVHATEINKKGFAVGRRSKLMTGPLLHLGYPRLTEYLLGQNADVNVLDDEGSTPLDSLVLRTIKGYIANFSPALASIYLIAQRGAKLRMASKQDWGKFLDYCKDHGSDPGVFAACGQPRWIAASKKLQWGTQAPEKGKRSIKSFISKRFSRS